MIQFKQKNFWGTALTIGATVGSTVIGGKMADRTQREATEKQEEMTRQQNKQMAKQTQALNNLAKAAEKNPTAANAGMALQKSYSWARVGTQLRNAGKQLQGFGKISLNLARDRNVGNKVASGLFTGATTAALGYGVNKAIAHDAKKNGLLNEEDVAIDKKKRLRNGVIAGSSLLAAGGLALGAKYGKLPGGMNNAVKKVPSFFKKAANDYVYSTDKAGKKVLNKTGLGLTAGFGVVMPVGSYLMKKRQIKQQVEDQGQQKQFAAVNFGSILRRGSQNIWKGIKSAPKTIGKGAVGITDSFLAGGAIKGTDKLGRDLVRAGNKENNVIAKKLGGFIGSKYGKTVAKVAAVPVGYAVTMKTWDMGGKAVRGTMGAVDKNAYSYERSQEQQVK